MEEQNKIFHFIGKFIKKFQYKLLSCWQRLTKGYADEEIWNLDLTIAKFILPRLKAFRKMNIHTKPTDMEVDKIIEAFEFTLSDDFWIAQPKEHEKHQKGLELFAQNFWSFWT